MEDLQLALCSPGHQVSGAPLSTWASGCFPHQGWRGQLSTLLLEQPLLCSCTALPLYCAVSSPGGYRHPVIPDALPCPPMHSKQTLLKHGCCRICCSTVATSILMGMQGTRPALSGPCCSSPVLGDDSLWVPFPRFLGEPGPRFPHPTRDLGTVCLVCKFQMATGGLWVAK